MSQGHAGATIAALSMAMLVVGVGVAALAITLHTSLIKSAVRDVLDR